MCRSDFSKSEAKTRSNSAQGQSEIGELLTQGCAMHTGELEAKLLLQVLSDQKRFADTAAPVDRNQFCAV